MLYYPWFDKKADLLGSYPDYEAHYSHVSDNKHTNEATVEAIDDIDIYENGQP